MQRASTSIAILGLAAGLMGFMAVFTPPPPATALANCITSSAGLDSAERALVSLVNDERAARGVAPLAVSANLYRAAAWKSEDPSVVPPLSHRDSLGRNPSQRAQDCGYSGSAGENIAWGFSSAQSVFNGWMNSSGHQQNLLSANYMVIGVGRSGTSRSTAPISSPTPQPPPPRRPHSDSDSDGHEHLRGAPAPRSIRQPDAPTINLPGETTTLLPRFNLVTYAGRRQLATRAFDSIGAVELWVYDWDPNSKQWYRFLKPAPDYLNTLASVEPGHAYII